MRLADLGLATTALLPRRWPSRAPQSTRLNPNARKARPANCKKIQQGHFPAMAAEALDSRVMQLLSTVAAEKVVCAAHIAFLEATLGNA